jgi:His/Glu/Gln/Arg/opine family amino acid ABC transporter permease subunit
VITVGDVQEFLPLLIQATSVTLELTVLSFALASVGGLLIAVARVDKRRAVRWPATVVVESIRGTPLIFQLFTYYYILPNFGIIFDPFPTAVVGLAINYSAYMSEVYRAGIVSIDPGQVEAGLSLGMGYRLVLRRVVLPQAVRVVLPPLGNYLVAMFKDTALASVVTVKEVLFEGQILAASTFKYVPIFLLVGAIYFAISYPASLLVQYVERRLKRRPPRPTEEPTVGDGDRPGAARPRDRAIAEQGSVSRGDQ